ncbi:MAG: tRNA (adenosine(37)-N6)-threonylcarbamoyltransferase complex dimerization subunit type 1 TsaB [Chloroflexi bacterium]|nr:tRNA (adenosine(37)-N6)-threonylcarbamoyltransferase complex dimerization subunit type 1 TsaB [Chloroflexota bacterium]
MANSGQIDTRSVYDLGIDTASDDGSLALFATDGSGPVAVHTFHAEGTMTRSLMGEIAAFLDGAGVSPDQIGRIAVTIGPGQYGALRAGIAVAQGMALALDAPLAGINRLQADAALVTDHGAEAIVAVHLTRSGPGWAAYTRRDGVPHEVSALTLSSYEGAATDAPRPATWTGELDDALHAARDAAGRTGDTIAAAPEEPRAVAIVRLARARDAFGDPAAVDAIYLRPPPITRPREAQPEA